MPVTTGATILPKVRNVKKRRQIVPMRNFARLRK